MLQWRCKVCRQISSRCAQTLSFSQASAWGPWFAVITQEPFQRCTHCASEFERQRNCGVEFDWFKTRKPLKRFRNIEPYRNPQAKAWGE